MALDLLQNKRVGNDQRNHQKEWGKLWRITTSANTKHTIRIFNFSSNFGICGLAKVYIH